MLVENKWNRSFAYLASLLLGLGLIAGQAAAQYTVTNIVSNQAGKAKTQDKDLVNAWGMSFASGGAFWISDEGTGKSTFYNGSGSKFGSVTVPTASGSGTGTPTGQVYNSSQDFQVTQGGKTGSALFIFDTLDGTISGWSPSVNSSAAVLAATKPGAVYTGLAIGSHNGKNFIFAADVANNVVDIYNGKYKLTKSFTDTKLSGFAPYGIQNINGLLYVTFTDSTGAGVVDIFDTGGKKKGTFTKSSHLNAPWGLAMAPSNFGVMSNALLVGNFGDGKINAFDATTKKFLGALKDGNGKTIKISGLWALEFGQGGGNNGNPNQLFFAAGPNGEKNGLFGRIDAQ